MRNIVFKLRRPSMASGVSGAPSHHASHGAMLTLIVGGAVECNTLTACMRDWQQVAEVIGRCFLQRRKDCPLPFPVSLAHGALNAFDSA